MSFLLRMRSGGFGLDSSITLEEAARLAECGNIGNCLISIENALEPYPPITVASDEMKKLLNGVRIKLYAGDPIKMGICRIFEEGGQFAGLGEVLTTDGIPVLKMKCIFI